MSERLPDDRPDWERREEAIARAREAVGDGLVLGTITVKYHSDDAAYGDVWLIGECSACDATVMMRGSYRGHLGQLAMAVARQECSKRGHQQDLDAMLRELRPPLPEHLTEAQDSALSDVCDRFGVIYDPSHYGPTFDLPDGWVAGWVGGAEIQQEQPTIYVGCSPEGETHS